MSLNRGEVNALNVLGFRKLPFIPKHFSKISVDPGINKNLLAHWIEYHLNSRYAIVSKFSLSQNKKIVIFTEIGLEDPKELTMLTLGCHLLHEK